MYIKVLVYEMFHEPLNVEKSNLFHVSFRTYGTFINDKLTLRHGFEIGNKKKLCALTMTFSS